MSEGISLSTGCLKSILNGIVVDKPVVQILGSRKVNTPSGIHRFRLLISDGKYHNSYGMLDMKFNDWHARGELDENTIIRLDCYSISDTLNLPNGTIRILCIIDLSILNRGSIVGQRLGNPVSYNGEISNSGSWQPQIICPIASLKPYQSNWAIKARITWKSPMHSWSDASGINKVFNMSLMDESSEIKAVAFCEIAETYFDMIEVGKVYYISKCELKPANKKFNPLNDYRLEFTTETILQQCEDDGSFVPMMRFNFVPISQIANIEPKTTIDVIGVCNECSDIQKFKSKTNNKDYTKREVALVDSSNATVTLTLWGDDAVNFDGLEQPVVLVKGGSVMEFGGGKTINVGAGSLLKINPDISEGHNLRSWFDNGGADCVQASVSSRSFAGVSSLNCEWITFHEAQMKNFGASDKPDYFQVKGVIGDIPIRNIIYKACPKVDCNKKVIDVQSGVYRCEKCNQNFHSFKFRLVLYMSIADSISKRWVNVFHDVSEQLLGKSVVDVMQEMETHGAKVLSLLRYKTYVFNLRAKMELEQGSRRRRTVVLSAKPINYKEYNKYLIKELNDLIKI